MERPRFGLQLINRRYSVSNSLKGNKLSTESMNRTLKMRLKKIDQIRTARSELELFIPRQDIVYNEEGEREFAQTNYRVLKANPQSNRVPDFEGNQLSVQPAKKGETKVQKPKPYYNSQNLQVKMNFYLNNMLNRSQEEHKLRLKEIESRLEKEIPLRKTTYNTRNLFWKKMRRQISSKSNNDSRQAPSTSRC